MGINKIKPLSPKTTVNVASLSTMGLAWFSHIAFHIQTWRERLAREGFEQAFEMYTDFLEQGSSQTLYARLPANQEFRILGVGDDDVKLLKLELFDWHGCLVDQHNASDQAALVSVQPVQTGEYGLRITLASCHYYVCEYGIVVFAKS